MGAFCSRRARAGQGEESGSLLRRVSRESLLVADNSGKHPEASYEIEAEPVGVGGFGSVRLATSKTTGQACAMKTIKKSAVSQLETLWNEVRINLEMDHPSIARLFDVFEDREYVYLCFEACAGGEVLDRIIELNRFSETDAIVVMKQLLGAVTYMHANCVAHRDLKLDNLLLQDKGTPIGKNVVKLIDFGLAKRFRPGGGDLRTRVGTSLYVAPEVIELTVKGQPYSALCDMWSCGVILYMLVSGSAPFQGSDDQEILRSVQMGRVSFDGCVWNFVSRSAKRFITDLCKREVCDRLTARAALDNAWLSRGPQPAAEETPVECPAEYFENLRKFGAQNRFKKMAIHIMAHRLDQEQLKELRSVFQRLDTNHDGKLSLEEMRQGFQQCTAQQLEQVESLFRSCDTNLNGEVEYTEFVAAAMDHKVFHRDELCWEAFRVFDKDNDGQITGEELREVFSQGGPLVSGLDPAQAKALLKRMDANGDGKVDFREFVEMLQLQS